MQAYYTRFKERALKLGKDWTKVSVSKDMCERIERIMQENPDLGYKSVSDFVVDASRKRIEELEKRHGQFKGSAQGTSKARPSA